MEDLLRLSLVLPGVIAQAIRVAEHTVLPMEYVCRLVYDTAIRHGIVPDEVYETAIARASAIWHISESHHILSDAQMYLRLALP